MKKLACIFAIALFSVSMISCTNDTAEDQSLYETQATDGNSNGSTGRDG
ncbi:hypothetical protein [Muriicola marianensis]|nr:hypothetical protein [Muriicola marianensis]